MGKILFWAMDAIEAEIIRNAISHYYDMNDNLIPDDEKKIIEEALKFLED